MPAKEINKLRGKRIVFALCGFDLGGAERQALYLAEYLKELGCDVRVWGHHHTHRGPERVIQECERLGIPCAEYKFRWPCSKWALLRDASRLLLGLWRERPDVVLPYTPWPSVGCGLVWRWSPAQLCIWGQRDSNDLIGDAVERFAFRRSSAAICNAAHEAGYLGRIFGQSPVAVHVVPNGVAMLPPSKTPAEWRTELGVRKDELLVAMLANFRPQKNHPTLLRAWSQILGCQAEGKKFRLVLAGATQESYQSVCQMITNLDLQKSVILPGQVKDVTGFLRACDIGVLSTTHEGLPNAVLEYMCCGLPVVATDIPGNREALGGDTRQLCNQGDANDLAAKLLLLLNSSELRWQLGAGNKRRAASEFSIDAMCERMASVIAGLIEGE